MILMPYVLPENLSIFYKVLALEILGLIPMG